MKKRLIGIFSALFILSCSTMVHAYSYSGDIVSGWLSLDVTADYESASLTTPEPLVVDFEFDPAPCGGVVSYTASATLSLNLLGFYTFELELPETGLGSFAAPDLSTLLGDGVNPAVHAGSREITGAFGGYSLTGANLDYDFTFTPEEGSNSSYEIAIDELTLSGGNTSELLSGIVEDLNQSGQVPLPQPMKAPFKIPAAVNGGTFEIRAAAPVPVPAAVWLLGSGLLGIVGIRRKLKV
ncbi:MAG: VPLPA-CTERM sorting domain-containing protein [Desulfobacteraceae bacterium]|nr:VPLPA-CTERM sorting domain-containing protein [Desulfobacteraceae bacterium]